MQVNVMEYLEQNTEIDFLNKFAVIDGENKIIFEKLINDVKVLADILIGLSDTFKKPIGVFLPKSYEVIVADLAIIYSGNIYNNLDVKSPQKRTKNICDNIEYSYLITNKKLYTSLLKIGIPENMIICIDEICWEKGYVEASIVDRMRKIIDTDPLCIINTSGSTGTPKGVVMNHRNIIDFIDNATTELNLDGQEVIGSLSPFYFDIYTLELYLMLSKRATIVLIPETFSLFPAKLVEFLAKNEINFIFWVPTIMVNIANLDVLSQYNLTKLKKILFAGEVFPTKHLNYWQEKIKEAVFVNMYGPIEITVDCLYYIVDCTLNEDEKLPIGNVFKNTDILVLNNEDQVCGTGEYGELCVRGTSLAMGYWNDMDKTRKAFVQNPLNKYYPEIIYRTGDIVYYNADGNVMFIGRKDFQIKHMGYRIDLSEIEHIILNLKEINNACVLYHYDKKQITVFYESKSGLESKEIRARIGEILPKYMIPAVYNLLNEMPRNANGKIDRNQLKQQLEGA